MILTQLGDLFGVTSHQIGRWLTEVGLRDDNKPTAKAFDGDFCVSVPSRNQGFHYAWRVEKVIPLLVGHGHRLRFPLPESLAYPPKLNPPFCERTLPGGGFEISNGDGTVCVRVDGSNNTRWLVQALNTAAKFGHFGPKETSPTLAVDTQKGRK